MIFLFLIVTFLVFFCLFWNIRKALKTYFTFQRYFLIIIWKLFTTLSLQLGIMIFLIIFFQLQHLWTLFMLWLTNYLKNTYVVLTLPSNWFFWINLMSFLIIILWRKMLINILIFTDKWKLAWLRNWCKIWYTWYHFTFLYF